MNEHAVDLSVRIRAMSDELAKMMLSNDELVAEESIKFAASMHMQFGCLVLKLERTK